MAGLEGSIVEGRRLGKRKVKAVFPDLGQGNLFID